MKKLLKNLNKKFKYFLFLFFLNPLNIFAFGGGDLAGEIADKANEQIESVTSSVASVVNTLSFTIGIVWIVIMILTMLFSMERFKEHAKILFGALAVIGIVYGLSKSLM